MALVGGGVEAEEASIVIERSPSAEEAIASDGGEWQRTEGGGEVAGELGSEGDVSGGGQALGVGEGKLRESVLLARRESDFLGVFEEGVEAQGELEGGRKSVLVAIALFGGRGERVAVRPSVKVHVDLRGCFSQKVGEDFGGGERRNAGVVMFVEGVDDLVGDEGLARSIRMEVRRVRPIEPRKVEVAGGGSAVVDRDSVDGKGIVGEQWQGGGKNVGVSHVAGAGEFGELAGELAQEIGGAGGLDRVGGAFPFDHGGDADVRDIHENHGKIGVEFEDAIKNHGGIIDVVGDEGAGVAAIVDGAVNRIDVVAADEENKASGGVGDLGFEVFDGEIDASELKDGAERAEVRTLRKKFKKACLARHKATQLVDFEPRNGPVLILPEIKLKGE